MASTQPNVDTPKDKFDDIKQKASEKSDDIMQRTDEAVNKAKGMLEDAGTNIQAQSEHLYEAISTYVKENPLKAIGMAALAGGMLAILMRK